MHFIGAIPIRVSNGKLYRRGSGTGCKPVAYMARVVQLHHFPPESMKDEKRANRIAETLSSPRGRRKLAWEMLKPMFCNPFMTEMRAGPWEGYPDSPPGTVEVWDEERLNGRL